MASTFEEMFGGTRRAVAQRQRRISEKSARVDTRGPICADYIQEKSSKSAIGDVNPPRPPYERKTQCFRITRGRNLFNEFKDLMFVEGKGESAVAAFVAEMREWEHGKDKPNPLNTRKYLSANWGVPGAPKAYKIRYRGTGAITIDSEKRPKY